MGNSDKAIGNEEAGQADEAADRSMRALLLDEEAGAVERGADRPLRLLRANGAETDAAAPPRSTASAPAEKNTTSPTSAAQGPNRGTSPADKTPGAVPSAPARVESPSSGSAAVRAPVAGSRGAPAAAGAERPGQAVGAAVIPGLGPANGGHIGATVGLLNGVATHLSGQPRATGDGKHQQIATWAQHDPARYGADLLLYGHNRKRYEELSRAGRLPSQVWAEHEATGQLERHLRSVHERYGEQLRQLYRERPMAERAILGLAAATGSGEDVVRALDALRVHPRYPARVSFARLVHGFSSPEIARVAAAFLPGHGSESAVEVYRAIREARERALIEKRRRLLRMLREHWASEQPAIVPLFEGVTRFFSPAQAEMLRRELERSGDVEAVFEQVEIENLRHRLDAMEAAFRRWFSEWEASRDPSAQTPLQEPHVALDALVLPRPIPLAGAAEPPSALDSENQPDSQRQLALQRPGGDMDTLAEVEDDGDPADDAQGLDEAGAPQALRAPPPGAHAADGVLPWRHLSQGFGRASEARLRRAWDAGRQWDTYREVLARRGEAMRAAREAAFLRHLEWLRSRWPRFDREWLVEMAPLGAGFTPEQWARLVAALTDGTTDPLEVWREIERENLVEAISVREPAFLRYMGAWGHAPTWNPLEWASTAPQLGRVLLDEEASGLLEDLGRALGGVDGREALSTVGQGIGALFGGAASGGGQGGRDALGGKLRDFAEQAIGALTGRKTPTRPKAGPSPSDAETAEPVRNAGVDSAGAGDGTDAGDGAAVGAAVGDVLSVIDKTIRELDHDGAPGAPSGPGAAPTGGFDPRRVLAQWVGPQSRLGERVVRGLHGIGLYDLAGALPKDLLSVVACRAPRDNDPSRWWHELTAGQGLSDSAEGLLRKTIDADGPNGIGHTIGTYVRMVEDATRAQKEQREALFTKILAAAQRVAGPNFDPASLPGGDPFVLLSRHTGDWQRVVDAMKRGNDPLAVFRQVEDERLRRLLRVDAPEWMAGMLSALWEQREGAGWVPDGDVGDPEDAGAPDPRQGRSQPGRERPPERPQPGREIAREPGRVIRQEPIREVARRPPVREVARRPPVREVVREPIREVARRPPVREVVREPIREVVRRPIRVHDPFHELMWRRPVRPIGRWPAPLREILWGDQYSPIVSRPAVSYVRPRPLYHLSFGRPMSERELRRFLTFVPQLRAHPYGVLAEMAGLIGQARDVRGVDATTGEYLLLPGETLADVAFKLVGDRRRWRELVAANPLRAEGDPRVRIPPSWFGYVPYSIPLRRVRELIALRRRAETGDPGEVAIEEAGDVDEAGDDAGELDDAGNVDEAGEDAGEIDGAGDIDEVGEDAGELDDAGDVDEAGEDAGHVRRRFARRAWRRRAHRRRYWRAPGSVIGPVAIADELVEDDEEPEGPGDAGAPGAGAAPPHRYVVTKGDVRTPLSPDHTREAAEAIAIRHGLWDGERWLLPRWWPELRDVNQQKPLNPNGWWRDISEGEALWIPGGWPVVKQRSAPGASDTGDAWDTPPEEPPAEPEDPNGWAFARNPANRGPRRNLTRQTYTVVRGDWPQRIARRFGVERGRHWLSELLRANPHKPVDSGIGNWFTLYPGEVINIPDAWIAADTGELDDADAGAPRSNLTTRTYAVVAGEGMQKIAQKLGAASRPHWFAELRDANPHKRMLVDGKGRQLMWQSLAPGEIINIPDAWPDSPQLRPAPGGSPTPAPYPGLSQFPTFPGGAVPSPTAPPGTVPAGATVDPGTILRVQAILIAFRQIHPHAILPKDFGTGMPFSPDATGVLTPRTQQALASFQRWSNATTGSRLRTDGVLDPATIAALDSFAAQAIGGLPQRPPVTPVPGAAPARGDDLLAQVLGAAAAAAGDLARRGAPGAPPQAPAADRDSTDPFAGLFRTAGELLRAGGAGAQPGAPPAPRPPEPPAPRRPSPPRMPVPRVPAPPVLEDLPEALEQYGIPGVPGLPGGAPHAPQPRRPRVAAPVPPPPEPPPPDVPPEAPAPAAKKKPDDDAVVPVVLTGLGILSGLFV